MRMERFGDVVAFEACSVLPGTARAVSGAAGHAYLIASLPNSFILHSWQTAIILQFSKGIPRSCISDNTYYIC
jgi:hypothetical protein